MKLYQLGGKGSFCYVGGDEEYCDECVDFKGWGNVQEVIEGVSEDTRRIGVVGMENAIEGRMNMVGDGLGEENVFGVGEIY